MLTRLQGLGSKPYWIMLGIKSSKLRFDSVPFLCSFLYRLCHISAICADNAARWLRDFDPCVVATMYGPEAGNPWLQGADLCALAGDLQWNIDTEKCLCDWVFMFVSMWEPFLMAYNISLYLTSLNWFLSPAAEIHLDGNSSLHSLMPHCLSYIPLSAISDAYSS